MTPSSGDKRMHQGVKESMRLVGSEGIWRTEHAPACRIYGKEVMNLGP